MSFAEAPAGSGRLQPQTLLIALVALLGFFGAWYMLTGRQQVLQGSPAGLDGLRVWLTSEDLIARKFTGGWPIDAEGIGLQVIPIYDTDFNTERQAPTTQEELLLQQDEADLDRFTLLSKARRVPTLLVLPKWRTGMRLTGLAHPLLRVERRRLDALLTAITGVEARLDYSERALTDFAYQGEGGAELTAQVYAAQVFASDACKPLIGEPSRMLLAECRLDGGGKALILADPDLLNNHGLRLGQNALIARDLLGTRANGQDILIDYSRDNWLFDADDGPSRERTWADLARFFGPPFTLLWLGIGLITLLFLWRASVRYGPVLPEPPTMQGIQPIRARSRLMRLTGQDGTMVSEYASARIAAVAARLVGPGHARQVGEERAFQRYLERHRPTHAARFAELLARLRNLPPRIAPAEAIRQIDEFENILQQVADDA